MNFIQNPDIIKKILYGEADDLGTRIYIHKNYSKSGLDWDDWVISRLPARSFVNVLDLGCGNGRFIFSLLDRKIGNNFTGIDISESNIDFAKSELLRYNNTNVVFRIENVEEYRFEQSGYDLIMCNHMLWHMKKLSEFLGKISVTLCPEGILLITTNSAGYMRKMYDLHLESAGYLGFPENILKQNFFNNSFSVENGYEILSGYFRNIKKNVLKDELEFSELTPFMKYYMTFLKSQMKIFKNIDENLWIELIKLISSKVENEIKTKGKFIINKTSGAFIANK